ncbi:MAG: hypothetical protein A2156_11085 [Deltaproteobacteria bacterium RBG_16_48_10]|nr:MAG: hypothetical protein A2156_11085 [Deltaproteobacteria bacterium RBG_16_48_10]
MFNSENVLLTFFQYPPNNLPSSRFRVATTGGRGFTLLDRTRVGLQGLLKNLSNRVKGRGDQRVFILSTPTVTLPHRKGGGE